MKSPKLELSKFIGKGATRLCFEHPENSQKCVKVAMRYKEEYLLEREINTYKQVRLKIGKYLPEYQEKLAQTNLGKGMICEFLSDHDGKKSHTLDYYLNRNMIDDNIKEQMREFAKSLIQNKIIFYDFNLENFIIQIASDGRKKLYYTDLKSYQRYKPWTFLGLEKIITPLALYLMKGRLKRLFNILNINNTKLFK